jgi:outer membrane autotransporter protein
MDAVSGATQLINNGTISGTVPLDAMFCGAANCTAVNSAGASITLSGPASTAMTTANSLNGVSLTNNGSIMLSGNNSIGMQTAFGGFSNTILNTGSINVNGGTGSIGIAMGDCNGNGCFFNPPGTVSTATNSGKINVTGAGNFGFAFVTQFIPDSLIPIVGQPIGPSGNTFFNTGSVVAGPGAIAVGDIAQVHGLENARPSFNSVVNTGVIDGQIALSQGTSETLTNSGLITISYPGSGVVHSINGTFTQTSSGTLALRVDANGGNDKLAVTGVANLAGTLQVLAQLGVYMDSTTYTVVTATGGVNGTFANVISNMALLTPTLTYDADDVFLTLKRIRFCSLAVTANQCSVANALQQFPTGNPLLAAVLGQTAPGARQAFDALSGEIYATVQTAILDDTLYARQAVLGRLRQAAFAGGTEGMAALGAGGPTTAYAEPNDPFLAYADARRPVFPVKAPPLARPDDLGLAFWAQGIGAWGHINSDGNAADASRNLAGFFSGFDQRLGNWRAGLAAGFFSSSVAVGARASSASVDTGMLAAYAGTSYGPWNLRTGTVLAWNQVSAGRSILFPGFVDAASAHYGVATEQVFAEVGYGMMVGRLAAEPFAGLALVDLRTGSFNEAGGIAALTGGADSEDVGYSTLGVRAATSYALPNDMLLTPRASVAWQHAIGQVTPSAALAFTSPGVPFTIAGLPLARDEALVEAGLDVRVQPQATVGLYYVGQLASSAQDHSVKGNFTWKF